MAPIKRLTITASPIGVVPAPIDDTIASACTGSDVPETPSIPSPSSSCMEVISTAAPAVNPVSTDSGRKSRIAAPPANATASRISPARTVSVARTGSALEPITPPSPRYGDSAARISRPVVLVGPVTICLLLPSSTATRPGIAAVTSPYAGGTPDISA